MSQTFELGGRFSGVPYNGIYFFGMLVPPSTVWLFTSSLPWSLVSALVCAAIVIPIWLRPTRVTLESDVLVVTWLGSRAVTYRDIQDISVGREGGFGNWRYPARLTLRHRKGTISLVEPILDSTTEVTALSEALRSKIPAPTN